MVNGDEVSPAVGAAEAVWQLVPVRQTKEFIAVVPVDAIPVERKEIFADEEDWVARILISEIRAMRTRLGGQEVRPHADLRARIPRPIVQVLLDAARAAFLVDRDLDCDLSMLVASPPGRVIKLSADGAILVESLRLLV
jgi:hypothetical protein